MIPLILRLKKIVHKEIAKAQDTVIETMYEVFDDAVLHGGTPIWRCYRGSRFSEDIDVYLNRDMKKISQFFEMLERKGFVIEKKKIGERSIFSVLRTGKTIIRFEAVFKKTSGSLREYETAEGNLLTIYTLMPEEIINEKAAAYIKRLKIRDLYDIFFLLRYVKDISLVRKSLEKLLAGYKKPSDEKDLSVLITEGLAPDAEKMMAYIRERL